MPSLSVWAASGTERRSRSGRRRLRPTHTATLVNATVLRGATAADCRVFDCSLGAGDHWKGLSHLGPSVAAVGRSGGSVEGAVGSALSSVRDKVWRGEAGGQGGVCKRAHGGRALELAGRGKDRPLTRVRRAEKSSGLSSFSSRGLLDGVHGVTLKSAEVERLGFSKSVSRFSICDRDAGMGR